LIVLKEEKIEKKNIKIEGRKEEETSS